MRKRREMGSIRLGRGEMKSVLDEEEREIKRTMNGGREREEEYYREKRDIDRQVVEERLQRG